MERRLPDFRPGLRNQAVVIKYPMDSGAPYQRLSASRPPPPFTLFFPTPVFPPLMSGYLSPSGAIIFRPYPMPATQTRKSVKMAALKR
jgi:hypothetical protein